MRSLRIALQISCFQLLWSLSTMAYPMDLLAMSRKVPAREIKPYPCDVSDTNETGICMFAWHCRNFQGKHLKACFDGVFVGSCCKLPEGFTTTQATTSEESNVLTNDINQPPTVDAEQNNHLVPSMGHPEDKPPPKRPSVPFVEHPVAFPTPSHFEPTTGRPLISLPTGSFSAEPVTSTSFVTSYPDLITSKRPSISTTSTIKSTTDRPRTTTNVPISVALSTTKRPIYIRVTTRKPVTGSNATTVKPNPTKPIVEIHYTTPLPSTPLPANATNNPITIVDPITTMKPTTKRPSTTLRPSSSTAKKPTRKPSTTTKRPTPTKRPTTTTKRPTTTRRPTTTTTRRPTPTKKPTPKPVTTKKPATVKPSTTTPPFIEATENVTTSGPSSTNKPVTNGTSIIEIELTTEMRPPNVTDIPVSSTTTTTTTNSVETTTIPYGNGTTVLPRPTNSTYVKVCGRPQPGPQGRIVGGENAHYAEWPWMISLRQWKKNTFLHKCGSALLNEIWAITAAHCVENVSPSDLLLRLGEYDVSSDKEPETYEERRVQIVASHPKFDPRTFEYDLALLRFYEPVKFKRNIIPVCLPDDDDNYVDRTATVTGWGRLYEDGPLPHVLQKVNVPIITNKECESMYRKAGFVEDIPDIFICAGKSDGGKDSCEGDSGGPMVLKKNGRWILTGIISWGIGCALPNQPGVYTRISKFANWIEQIIAF